MNLNQKVTFAETVFAQEVDVEMVPLDMESENYFGLDEVEEEMLEKDLSDFVGKLVESGLVKVEEH